MTQEEIQQKAYEVYPLDLDRHMIIEGEPYDNNKEKREAYIRGLTDSKPELTEFKKAVAQYLDGKGLIVDAHIQENAIKTIAAKLLDLARKQLVEEQYTSDPSKTDLYKLGKAEALEELKKNLADNDIYRVPEWLREVLVMAKENGKKEALKDLPRWKKIGRGSNYSLDTKFIINGRYLEMTDTLNDVFEVALSELEKLPKEG